MTEKYILGVKVNFGLNYDGVLEQVEKYLHDGKCHHICTTNPDCIMYAQKDEEFMKIINAADLSVPEGVGVFFAASKASALSPLSLRLNVLQVSLAIFAICQARGFACPAFSLNIFKR